MKNLLQIKMLPTNQFGDIGEFIISKYDHDGKLACGIKIQEPVKMSETRQHLYFLSENNINNGDWYHYEQFGEHIFKKAHSKSNFENLNKSGGYFKKVVATTNREFRVHYGVTGKNGLSILKEKTLPKPSVEFINHYVDEYNKGDEIVMVDVEYEKYIPESFAFSMYGNDEPPTEFQLKVNPDNTINIFIDKTSDDYVKFLKEKIILANNIEVKSAYVACLNVYLNQFKKKF